MLKISGIHFEKFQEMVEGKFGKPLSEFKGEKFVYKPASFTKKKRSSRAPASIGDELEETESTHSNNTAMFWLMIILSVLGTSSYKIFNRKG